MKSKIPLLLVFILSLISLLFLAGEFEKNVLTLLPEINGKAEVICTNQSKMNMHILSSEKVISRPHGMPTLPLKSADLIKKMEGFLQDPDHVASVVRLFQTCT